MDKYGCRRTDKNMLIIHNARDNLNNREGQKYSTPVDKYHCTWTTQGVRCNIYRARSALNIFFVEKNELDQYTVFTF